MEEREVELRSGGRPSGTRPGVEPGAGALIGGVLGSVLGSVVGSVLGSVRGSVLGSAPLRTALPLILLAAACGREARTSAAEEPKLVLADLVAIEGRLAAGGGIRVVNFWATWCQPCVAELPELVALDAVQRERGVETIGISLDLTLPSQQTAIEAHVRDFLQTRGVLYENLLYTGSVPDLLEAFDLSGSIPSTLVIGQGGDVLWRHEGKTTRAAIEAALESAASPAPGSGA